MLSTKVLPCAPVRSARDVDEVELLEGLHLRTLELLGDRLGEARTDAAMRRAVDAAVNAVTDEYLRWTAGVSAAEATERVGGP